MIETNQTKQPPQIEQPDQMEQSLMEHLTWMMEESTMETVHSEDESQVTMMGMMKVSIFVFLTLMITMDCYGVTNPNDLRILNDFRKGLKNPKLLKWPDNGNDPCGPPSWSCVYCSGGRVTQIQTKNLGLEGSLPPK
ncbi:Protein STRUBBELIG-RECEPTOR FAMILY 4 [Glycine soja]